MNDYYDPSPRYRLHRPLALISYPEAGHRQVGHHLAARTGLPFVDLDRLVEHDAGMNRWDLLIQGGEESLRAFESQALARTLRARSPSILALGDGALLDEGNLRQVLEKTDLVYLHLDLANLYWRLRSLEDSRGRLTDPFLPHPMDSIDTLRTLYDQRVGGFRQAPHRVELAGRQPSAVAIELEEGWLSAIDDPAPTP